jgi:hypothetical protein
MTGERISTGLLPTLDVAYAQGHNVAEYGIRSERNIQRNIYDTSSSNVLVVDVFLVTPPLLNNRNKNAISGDGKYYWVSVNVEAEPFMSFRLNRLGQDS